MSLSQQLPALLVVLPLLAAPLAVLLRRGEWAGALVTACAWAAFACAIGLWLQVNSTGVITYALGSWPPPWGIEYRIDHLGSFVVLLVAGMAAIVLACSRTTIRQEIPADLHYLYYTMFTLCLAGLLGIVISGDAFNIFVFLEISSLSAYVLIALGRDRRALAAAYRYLIMGSIGASFIVIGIGFLYLMTGTLNLADMSQRLAVLDSPRPVLAALAFISVGISLKLALFPLHQWLPNAYCYAPSAVTAFLAATATKVSVYLLIRFHFSVFGEFLVFEQLQLEQILLGLSLLAMLVANVIAIFQNNLKRLFAYSSVGQIGYMTLGLSFASVNGLSAAIVHLFNHGIAKGAIFLLIGGLLCGIRQHNKPPPEATFDRLAGLAKRMPLTCFGIVIAGLSLIGVPGTAGFVSKWYLILAALEQAQYWLVAVIVISSLLAVAYVWRFIETAYFHAPAEESTVSCELSLLQLIPAWLLIFGCVWFGFDTSLTIGTATAAAQQLLQGVP